jgi:hypothetical protein
MVVMAVMMADTDADTHRPDMRPDHVGAYRARAQQCQGKY